MNLFVGLPTLFLHRKLWCCAIEPSLFVSVTPPLDPGGPYVVSECKVYGFRPPSRYQKYSIESGKSDDIVLWYLPRRMFVNFK